MQGAERGRGLGTPRYGVASELRTPNSVAAGRPLCEIVFVRPISSLRVFGETETGYPCRDASILTKTMKTFARTLTAAACLLALASPLVARTWTSADGTKTFEGDFVGVDDGIVTVLRGRTKQRFKMEVLSKEDIAFIEKQEAIAASAKFKGAAVPKAISGKLVRLEGGGLVAAPDNEVVPEFYFLAYTASW